MDNLSNNQMRTGLEIAVIGMAGRFPGAGNVQQFWENLKNGLESISYFSHDELEESGIEPGLIRNPNYVKAKGILTSVEYFDASFFDYTPAETQIMDPQMRFFHECSWEALEDSGYNPDVYNGLIGLYAGSGFNPYWLARHLPQMNTLTAQFEISSLNAREYLTTRISYKLNLKGPAVTILTACSTSLVAIHLACQGILSGECDMALAGGISILFPSISLPRRYGNLYQDGMILSPDGHCRAFDAEARGTNGGDGVGIVVLKALEAAIADRDHIYAVVKGSAINNDGNSKVGYTAPSAEAQAAVICAALSAAEVDTDTISYIETHGTGTMLGDPIEIEGLKLAFDSERVGFCAIGSVKTNCGHLDTAAGVAGFIKTALALKHGFIPPSLHFQKINPGIDFENSPFYVNTILRQWEDKENGHPLRAGVSSFGIGGTNAHVILEEPSGINTWLDSLSDNGISREYQLVLLSAKNFPALDRMTDNFHRYLRTNPDLDLANAAYTLQVGRKIFPYKRMLICPGITEAIEVLSNPANMEVKTFHQEKNERYIIFMFPGLGSQYVNMGSELYSKEPYFRREMDRCFEILEPITGYDVKSILYPHISQKLSEIKSLPDFRNIEIAQLVVFIFEYALARLLLNWGIKPHAMIGYSFGEYTAACISGVFSLEDALKLVIYRGQLIQKMPPGKMLSVPLSAEECEPLLDEHSSLAIDNGLSCIVAGPASSIEILEKQLKNKKLLCMPLETSHAIHSNMMEPILTEFEEKVKEIRLNSPRIPFISNLTGKWLTGKEVVNPGYWSAHLRNTMRFGYGIRELLKKSNTLFVEVGPGRDLQTLLGRFLDESSDHHDHKILSLTRTGGKNGSEVKYLLNRLGYFWLYGVSIDWQAFYTGDQRYRISLPTYAFEKQYYWVDNIANQWTEMVSPGLDQDKRDNKTLFQRSQLGVHYVPPGSQLQEKLVDIWEHYFGISPIGILDDFFELGGDSLKAMNVLAIILKNLNIEIPLKEFLNRQTIANLAEYIQRKKLDKGGFSFSPINPIEKKEYYYASSAQRRMYVLHQLGATGDTTYNEPVIITLKGTLEQKKLQNIFYRLIQRHESFRTYFDIISGETVQKIQPLDEICWSIEEYECPGNELNVNTIIKNIIRPFDLCKAPLFRLGIIKETGGRFILVLDIHHIISDGATQSILLEDFIALYRENKLPQLRINYKDFAHWQNSREECREKLQQEEYWLKEFENELPRVNLPTDYPRPPLLSFEGSRIKDGISIEQVNALKEIASKELTTIYNVLLAIFNIFLSKLSGQDDIVVGTLLAGRRYVELHKVVGMFVNTLALRNYLLPEMTFTDCVKDIKERTVKAFENQDYQFEQLANKVDKNRETNRNPLFDIMFILQNLEKPIMETPGLKLNLFPYEHMNAKFDLRVDVVQNPRDFELRFEYCTKLFKEKTIRRFINYLKNLISVVIENPPAKIKNIEILSKKEKEHLLYGFNDTQTTYPEHKTLYHLFADQVERTPENIAVTIQGKDREQEHCMLTYRQLNEKAGHLAYAIRDKGIGPGAIIGLLMNPSLEAVIGILGIMKAGNTYLPIDPDYPVERIEYMMADSKAQMLITTRYSEEKYEGLSFFEDERILLEELPVFSIIPINNPSSEFGQKNDVFHLDLSLGIDTIASSLAYIIYTSGSTGKPKGIMVEHRNIVNYICWAIKNYVQNKSVNFPLFTSLSFDLTVTSIFTPLLSGNMIIVYDGDSKESVIKRIVEDRRVGVVKLTPSHLKLLLELSSGSFQSGIKRFILGGEALETQLAGKIMEKFNNNIEIFNEYGPTETAVGCMIYSYCPATDSGQSVPIGIPADNVQVYVLDKNRKTIPIGVPGELFIAGSGMARGYLNQPGLTAERFVENPFLKGKRMYKSGDQARHLEDWNIEFLGRIDQQVKIRGFRIEPGEIESMLREYQKKRSAPLDHQDVNIKFKDIPRCQRCLLSLNYTGLSLDDEGICNICREYETFKQEVHKYFKTREDFERLIEESPETSQGKYDCLLLFSGGKDSTYVLYQLIDMGLKVLAFTFDNGYISDAAFANIKRTTSELKVDNIVCKTEQMKKVFVESLKANNDVCHGCWHALNSFGVKVAQEHGIKLIISGLSRGQIFEMRLEGLFQQGIFDEEEIEENLQLFRKSFHSKSNKFTRILDVELDEKVVEQIRFIDFFRFFDTPVKEIREYLVKKGWKQPKDTGFCSSNCLINDVGIYMYLEANGCHFYEPQLSWDTRLGVIPRDIGLKEIAFEGDLDTVARILKEIGYYNSPIKDAVVLERKYKNGNHILTAYIVSDDSLLATGLKEYLATRLPDYMIPSEFVQVDKIPLTANGKVDRKELDKLGVLGAKLDSGVEYVAPKSGNEVVVADTWKEILKLEKVGIHDNFFDLGGTSVDIIRVNSRFKEILGKEIPIVIMYKYTTIASFSQFLDTGELEKQLTGRDRKETRQRGKTDKKKMREKRIRRRHEYSA